MLLNTIQMKSINSKIIITLFLLFFSIGIGFSQEIIKDEIQPVKNEIPTKKQKIDGVIAKVGDYNILDSDIDKSYLEISSQGNSIKDITSNVFYRISLARNL
jgi:peptidyl-prolyl cis-trans isomerase SurA